MPAGMFRLPEDTFMLEILDRHRIVSTGFDVPGNTGIAQ
jgi:hypothetical protein